MSKNRKRSRTRSLVSYANEGISRTRKRKPRLFTIKRSKASDTFGLPSELTRSPVHGFYKFI